MKIELFPIDELKEYSNNPRRVPDEAVKAVANSIREFGFRVPVIVDKDRVIVAGHTRVMAARELGLEKVPCIVADDLTPEQVKAFRLADNKTAELTGWDFEKLDLELEELSIDMSSFGFEIAGEEADTGAFFTEAETVEPPEKTVTPQVITCPECGAVIEL